MGNEQGKTASSSSKPNSFVESFNNLRDNKDLRLELAANAYKIFRKRFNRDKHIKAWGKLIERLLN